MQRYCNTKMNYFTIIPYKVVNITIPFLLDVKILPFQLRDLGYGIHEGNIFVNKYNIE